MLTSAFFVVQWCVVELTLTVAFKDKLYRDRLTRFDLPRNDMVE
jgi:hypothetical protein